jgi:hypothetical protein
VGAAAVTAAAGLAVATLRTFPSIAQEAPVRMLALLVLVAAPAYALGMILPTLLGWAERQAEILDDEKEDPSPWQPLGRIVVCSLAGLAAGTAVTGIVLVPYLGAGPTLVACAAVLMIPTLLRDPAEDAPEHRVLFEAESPLSRIRVVEILYPRHRQPERRLYVNDEEESGELVRSGAPTLAYIAAAEQWLAEAAGPGDRYYFLGGGAQTLPRRTAERDPKAKITVVELDPEVTRIAYRFFGIRRDHGIVTVHGDARAFLTDPRTEPVDRIYLDVYAGQEALPHALVTQEAFEEAAALLRPGGTITLNAIGITTGVGSLRLWSLVKTVAEVFPAITLFTHLGREFPDRQNVLIAASTDAGARLPERAGLFEPWPRAEWPQVSRAFVFRDIYTEPLPPQPVRREPAERSST